MNIDSVLDSVLCRLSQTKPRETRAKGGSTTKSGRRSLLWRNCQLSRVKFDSVLDSISRVKLDAVLDSV